MARIPRRRRVSPEQIEAAEVANTAEVRRGALRGPFQDLVEELAASQLLGDLAPVSGKSQAERIPEELVTRFFAYGDGLDGYRDSPSRFIFEYTKAMNARFAADAELAGVYRRRFEAVLAFVQRVFPLGFRKAGHANSTPRARFEAIAIGSDLALRERPGLADGPAPDVSWVDEDEFKNVTTSDAANVRSKLEARIGFVRHKLLEA